VIAAVTAVPPGAGTAWSHRLLAEHLAGLGISASQIGRILRDADLKPHEGHRRKWNDVVDSSQVRADFPCYE